jgi:16S rRNA G966 N2-methylase RsmD
MPDLPTNVLYYGDNLDILRRYLPDSAVDLVYLDPPFNFSADNDRVPQAWRVSLWEPSCSTR